MEPDSPQRIRELLEQRTKALAQEVIRSGGDVDAEQVEALERLSRLVELQRSSALTSISRRWVLFATLSATLVVAGMLLFFRVGETEVVLDLQLSEVTFNLTAPHQLGDGVAVSFLGASGLRGVELPQAIQRVPAGPEPSIGSDDTRVSVTASTDAARISLETFVLPADARVSIRHLGYESGYRLSLTGADQQLRAALQGEMDLALDGEVLERIDAVSPRALLLLPGAEEVDLELKLSDESQTPLASQLPVRDLSLLRIDEVVEGSRTLVSQASTIFSGTLYVEALDSKAYPLRSDEMVQFESVTGRIRTLRLERDAIKLNFQGRVRGLRLGSGESTRSIMPTWLEWLQARHGLSLFWATALYLFGLIAAVLRWYGDSR